MSVVRGREGEEWREEDIAFDWYQIGVKAKVVPVALFRGTLENMSEALSEPAGHPLPGVYASPTLKYRIPAGKPNTKG
jgi:hypothetical protein